jgi:hypothetical protein
MTTTQMATDPAAVARAAITWREPRIVRRYAQAAGASADEAERAFAAFKQFMVVCATVDEARSPSREIDEMWHTALLFTRAYEHFCTRHLGRHVHHEPIDGEVDISLYAATRNDAVAIFGELDKRYWPHPGEGPCAGSFSMWGEPGSLRFPLGAHRRDE